MSCFITFEGPEGGGKTSQIKTLGEWLQDRGQNVLITREPGGTAIGDRVRGILLDRESEEMDALAEILLFSAARAQLVSQVIRPHLAQPGGIVLCDRYADSTLAYQGYGRGLDLTMLRMITSFATSGLQPALTLFLDIPVEEGLARRQERGQEWNRLDAEELAFHQRVRDGYLALAADEPHRWAVLDASRPFDVVQQEIRQRVGALLHLPS